MVRSVYTDWNGCVQITAVMLHNNVLYNSVKNTHKYLYQTIPLILSSRLTELSAHELNISHDICNVLWEQSSHILRQC